MISQYLSQIASYVWNPILFLLIIGGLYFLIYSRFIQYKYIKHAIDLLRGKYDNPNDPGQINTYQALSTALASTVGMGNIAGVAAAIHIGGPGAIFWMWVTAFVGMSTNFITSSLSVMYRGKDSEGTIQGGPMYVIHTALGKPWRGLAFMFSVCTLIGCLPIFQANQLTEAIVSIGFSSTSIQSATFSFAGIHISQAKLIIGLVLATISGVVIIGGIYRIGSWAGKMVPLMIVIYFVSILIILILHIDKLPYYVSLIFNNAFTGENYYGEPALGGIVGGLIVSGVRRAAFSNEAGIGTAPMALGASKSSEPIREGLVSMLSPAIDSLLVCTCTALAILTTDSWKMNDLSGINLTTHAFNVSFPGWGGFLLLLCAFFFSITSLFSYSYYGYKALSYMIGVKRAKYYNYFYLITIVLGAISSMSDVINIIDIAYALMAIPTMVSGFILARHVMDEARSYFARMKEQGHL